MMPREESRCQLPGFGKPLTFRPKATNGDLLLFPNALNPHDLSWGYVKYRYLFLQVIAMNIITCSCVDTGTTDTNIYAEVDSLPLKSLRELAMLRFMNAITDKPGWETKVFDEEITKKWTNEALSNPSFDMTSNMAKYCIAELRHKATLYNTTRFVSVYPGDVAKSDTVIPEQLQQQLRSAVAVLENVPGARKDWHPGSEGKVLDLVHPSLFPLVYGHSRILPNDVIGLEDCLRRAGEGVVVPTPEVQKEEPRFSWERSFSYENKAFSTKFQWLPCDIAFVDRGDGGKAVKVVSYINNLHPVTHASLYHIIEQIIDYAIPMWNLTLTKYTTKQRIKYTVCEYDVDPYDLPESEWPQQGINEADADFYDRLEQWEDSVRVVKLPDVDAGFSPPFIDNSLPARWRQRVVDLKRDFGERGLQVIAKLANIHLTPESPEYNGGAWHVEGQLNEHICASAIYYYDSENITPSYLSFRHRPSLSSNIDYAQDEHSWLTAVFGCYNEEPTVQEVGDILTLPGRLVTFPNILQHCVKPFSLSDRSKPGHRKILALFLVDPNIRVISTANVPPQQEEWWAREVMQLQDSIISRFPPELKAEILMHTGFPMDLREAKRLREELMEERKEYVDILGREFVGTTFSLCEH